MRLKGVVMEMLRRDDVAGLEQLVAGEPRAVRFLQGRLWDSDSEVRRRAAEGLGAAAVAHPELATEVLRRAMWALNDESATNGGPMLAAVGEIGRRSPALVEPFVGPMTAYLWDAGLRKEILEALSRIAQSAPELITEIAGRLSALDFVKDPGERELIDGLLAVAKESANEQ